MTRYWSNLRDPETGRHLLDGLLPILLGLLVAMAGTGLGVYVTGVPVQSPWTSIGTTPRAERAPSRAPLHREPTGSRMHRLDLAGQARLR